jgi:hypothetical protein
MRALVALLAWAATAAAHPLAPSVLDLHEAADGRVVVSWKQPLMAAALTPVLPPACRPEGAPRVDADDVARTAMQTIRCSGPLAGATIGVAGPAARPDVVVRVALADGRVLHHVLRPGEDGFVVPVRAGGLDVVRGYVRLGASHIAGGIDHVLFLLGLVAFAPGWRALAAMVTAFTAGHAVTISLAALGWARLPAAPVEVAIALTILLLALELTRLPGAPPGLLRRHPTTLTFGFGLLHGLGFAGALREVGLPAGEIALALAGFNLGIEAGQLAIVAAAATVGLVLATRRAVADHGRRGLAYMVGSVAACLVVERTVGLLG